MIAGSEVNSNWTEGLGGRKPSNDTMTSPDNDDESLDAARRDLDDDI